MANPNIVAATNIHGRTDVLAVGTADAAITSNAVSSGKVLKVNSLVVSNTDGSFSVDVNVFLRRTGAGDFYIAKTISVPADASLVLIGKDNPVYLNEGDAIRIVAGTANSAHAICSYEEIY